LKLTPGQAVRVALCTYHPPGMQSRGVAQVLADARDLLQRDGWIRGRFVNGDGAHCSVGAVQEVGGWTVHDRNLVYGYLVRAYYHRRPISDFSRRNPATVVMRLNDGVMRDKQQVLQWFDAAIALAVAEQMAPMRPPALKIQDEAHEHILA
jgi:hypothetical protein